jgi:glycosyltransferase involved in cell wall biosynthesis
MRKAVTWPPGIAYNDRVNFIFLGGYDSAYPRTAVIRNGLGAHGDRVTEYPADPSFKAWLRYPLLLARIAAGPASRLPLRCADAVYVPAFCQKDVPLARFLATLAARPVVFDPLAPRHETKILDRGRRPADSLTARWNWWIDALAFRLADIVLADTAAHAAYYRSAYGVPARKLAVVPVGYDDALFDPDSAGLAAAPAPPVSGAAFTVLFFGSFLPLHGVTAVVEAARAVLRRDPAVRFRFVGSGDTWGRARALAADLGASNCAFEPWVPLAALPALIASADLVLGIFGRTDKARRVVPHKVFQSLGMRRAVITARTSAVEEFFAHGEDIWLCDEPYAGTLADAVLRLKADAALRGRLAAGGYRTVKERFTPPVVAEALRRAVAASRRGH